MKKFLKATLFLCALSSLAYAEDAAPVVTSGTTMTAEEQKDAMDILDRMRAKIEKEEAEKAKLVAEAKELGMSPSEIASMDNVDEMLKAKREAEVAGYYEIMGEEKARPSIMDEQKTEATEQASPAEVPQEAAPAEATEEQAK